MTPMRATMVEPFSSTTSSMGFDSGLPFRDLLFGRRQLLDIFRGILEGDELAAAGQGNGIVERSQLAAARAARRYFSAVQSH